MDSVKHIFMIRISGEWFKFSRVFSDPEFDGLMGKADWKMPFNIKAYHFHGDEDQRNPVVAAMPAVALGLDIESLLSEPTGASIMLWDKRLQAKAPVTRWQDQFVIVDHPDLGWPECVAADGERFSVVGKLHIVPVTLKEALAFVKAHHRHTSPPQGHKFSVGLKVRGCSRLVGVAIASVPKARGYDENTLEVNRICVYPCFHNGCSKLYGAVLKIGRVMGYSRFITYSLPEESESSLRAAKFRFDGFTADTKGWSSPSRPRKKPERYPEGKKKRWMIDAA